MAVSTRGETGSSRNGQVDWCNIPGISLRFGYVKGHDPPFSATSRGMFPYPVCDVSSVVAAKQSGETIMGKDLVRFLAFRELFLLFNR